MVDVLLQSVCCEHLLSQVLGELMQGHELHGHLEVHEEVHVQHSVRGLRLNGCHHGITAACRPAHGRCIAPERVHARICSCCAVGALGAHAEPVDRGQYHARHDLEGVYTTQGIPTCDESSRVVVGQIHFLHFIRMCNVIWRAQTG